MGIETERDRQQSGGIEVKFGHAQQRGQGAALGSPTAPPKHWCRGRSADGTPKRRSLFYANIGKCNIGIGGSSERGECGKNKRRRSNSSDHQWV